MTPTCHTPKDLLKSALPTVEEIEAELAPAAAQEQSLAKKQAEDRTTKKKASRPRSEGQA